VADEIDYIQTGQYEDRLLYELGIGKPQTSSWDSFPERYKFIGAEIQLNFDTIKETRSTYDLLALAGDIGGLKEALTWFGILLVGWYTKKNNHGMLVSSLFK
jgi:hypothetical protein